MNIDNFKLLLFDLDGTLLSIDRNIQPKNLDTISLLMKKGIRVGFATGRTYKSVQKYLAAFSPTGPHILFNGAAVWDSSLEKYVFKKELGLADAIFATELIKKYSDVHINLYVENEILISHKTSRSLESENKDGVAHHVVGDLSLWLRANKKAPIKIMFISEPTTLEKYSQEFSANSPSKCSLIRSEINYLEIMHEGINKGTALQEIESYYGISPAQIISFGDNLNDMELIRNSGLGIAMSNGHQDLKKIANRVIGDHNEPSISQFLCEQFGITS